VINLIFDFDGTLYDSSEGIYAAYAISCNATHCPKVTKASFASKIGPPIKIIAKELHPEITDTQLNQFVSVFRNQYDSKFYLKAKPYKGVPKLLQYLKESRSISTISIVTNKPTLPAKRLLEKYSCFKYFDKVIGIDYLAHQQIGQIFSSKSEAILFLKSILPDNNLDYVYVGDTFTDYSSSVNSGCKFLPVGYGYFDWQPHHDLFPSVVSSADELLQALQVFMDGCCVGD